MRHPIRNGSLDRRDVERGDILFDLPPPIASRGPRLGARVTDYCVRIGGELVLRERCLDEGARSTRSR